MRHALKLHPACRCDAVESLEVEVGPLSEGQLRLCYAATGRMSDLLVPASGDAERIDGLWRSTCFEAFVSHAGAEAYDEFNFSPSTRWAVYRFSRYREGMSRPDSLPPRIEDRRGELHYELHAWFELQGRAPWRLGLAAVIEETNGRKSYWALAHPSDEPDFHHAENFLVELA